MRVLFLVLLLANLLFLAWTRWVATPEPGVGVAAPQASTPLRPIRLRQEAQGAPGEAGPGTRTAPDDTVAAASCVSVGPFLEQAQADAASSSLQRLGFTARLRSATDEVRVGYWVRVPDLATPVDATNALAALQGAGLADAYVITDEAPGNVVSIGVYSDPRRAAEVAATVARAGFTPQTSDRVRTLDVFWLDVDRQTNAGIPELEDVGEPPEGGLPLELRVCPSTPVEVSTTEAAAEGTSR
ncbi:MAG TPA: SPOR domain-containing protein [Steroidobacteraceae bacterium]|nr:SPOR domain-containing protein [Steroidobacteraceae bacterium]